MHQGVFGESTGVGIGGAIVGFAIDQFSNDKEGDMERDTANQSKEINKEDANNHISVYATKNQQNMKRLGAGMGYIYWD